MRKILITLLAVLPLFASADEGSVVTEQSADPQVTQIRDAMRILKQSEMLPGTGFRIIDLPNGSTFLATVNGRYVIRNPVVDDMWSGKTIRNIDDMHKSRQIKFENLGFKFSELNAYPYGKGKQQAAVFVDPEALPDNLFGELAKLTGTYTFQVVPMPQSKQGYQRAMDLLCAKDGAKRLQTGNYTKLPTATCKSDKVARNLVIKQVFSLNRMPAFISPAGDVSFGMPDDLAAAMAK
jgi:hypothetical protein